MSETQEDLTLPEGSDVQSDGSSVDWIDAVLAILGFMAWLATLLVIHTFKLVDESLLEDALNFGALFALGGPVFLRRQIFGQPNLPTPRKSGFWSLVSIIGSLCIVGSAVAFIVSAVSFHRSLQEPPDLFRKARSLQRALPDLGIPTVVTIPAGATKEDIDKLNDEADVNKRFEKERELQRTFNDLKSNWERDRKVDIRDGIGSGTSGLGLGFIGVLCMGLRYPRKEAKQETSV
jgi:hypothetical protein